MAERAFVDTNVFVYASDEDAKRKRDRARRLVRELARADSLVISTQVLQEFFVVATRKLGLSADAARRRVVTMRKLDVVQVDPELILGAIDLHRLHAISFWDALVVRAASVAGCACLLTEDLAAGATIDGVRIENPFV